MVVELNSFSSRLVSPLVSVSYESVIVFAILHRVYSQGSVELPWTTGWLLLGMAAKTVRTIGL